MKRVLLLIALCIGLTGASCSDAPVRPAAASVSPFGVWEINSKNEMWLIVMNNGSYMLCSLSVCSTSSYTVDKVSGSFSLTGFFKSELGLAIEAESHGPEASQEFLREMLKSRMHGPHPDDLHFKPVLRQGRLGVELGHKEQGIRFRKVTRQE